MAQRYCKTSGEEKDGGEKEIGEENCAAGNKGTRDAAAGGNRRGKLSFNHAMVYCKDVQRGLGFYRDLLGFKLVDEFRFEGSPVYALSRISSFRNAPAAEIAA